MILQVVGVFFPTHLKKYAQVRLGSCPQVGFENKKCLNKPPPSVWCVFAGKVGGMDDGNQGFPKNIQRIIK